MKEGQAQIPRGKNQRAVFMELKEIHEFQNIENTTEEGGKGPIMYGL